MSKYTTTDFENFVIKYCEEYGVGIRNTDYTLLGLTEEIGEVSRLFRKSKRHQTEINKKELELELGDCLFYIVALSSNHGIKIDSIIESNIKKLKLKYES